ncbi:hypothetical protein BpHYR1_024744 [Brachionus plicatilis]|uniref:Uncharacterized protein n=1 Tax=Brachionus plicatilis TaxID=10195 RepID=A0A3M7P974_BRAPC|nr:hypothetical protein BpHYR1_024744 [Brachionus plicatilis]
MLSLHNAFKKQKAPFEIYLHRFCILLQKVKQQLFHFVSFSEQLNQKLKILRKTPMKCCIDIN